MAGNGPNGLMTRDILEAREKCPTSPTKRQYPTQGAAEEAATWRTREAGISIQAYACPDCGFFHLSRSSRLDRVLPQTDGIIRTASRPERKPLAPIPAERVDMSEIIAMESPIVAGNAAAREKLLRQYVEGKDSVTVPEIMIEMGWSRDHATTALHALEWQGARGRKEWLPPGVELPVTPPKPESIARMNRRSKTTPKRGPALHKARLRTLKTFLKDVDRPVSTLEIMELLTAGKDQTKILLRDAGWELSGWGQNARWVPAEKAVVDSSAKPAPRALHAVEPAEVDRFGRDQDEQAADPVAAAIERHPSRGLHSAISSEDGWRPVPDVEALQNKFVHQIVSELAVYGLEMRIEIREKRR